MAAMSHCPYCNSAQSLLMGNVYCSHQASNMSELDTGVLFLKSKKLEETDDHISRLSIRCMLKGEQHYKVGANDFRVTQQNYLVVNQGQNYRTSFEGDEEQEMILVGFKPGFAESLLYSLTTKGDKMIDEPFGKSGQPVLFFEKTYDNDPILSELFRRLRMLIDEKIEWRRTVDLDSLYTTMLTRLLNVHRNLFSQINKIDRLKYSTRAELYKRLSFAKDFMDAHPDRKLSVEEVSRVACLSSFHFKRSFSGLFGISPHAYHVQKRLEYSCKLLSQGSLNINEVCIRVGFEDPSSFIRLFRKKFGITPGKFLIEK